MENTDLAFAGIAKQAQLLRDGEVTSPQLLELYLERIARLNPTLNAFNAVYEESARSEAAAAQARIEAGETAPLLGVPIAIKDNVDIAGEITAKGSAGFTEPATEDAEIVKRLRAAGAVIIGKTNLPEFAMFAHFTSSKRWGVTRNPWNTERSTGGSSGGSAAAVAAGLVGSAMASDGGGSIRVPAAHCGLFGLKPQRGRVSLLPDAEHWYHLSVFGSVARTVADGALFMDVVAGPAPGDADVAEPPSRPYAECAASDPPKLRIALSTKATLPGVFLKKPMKAAIEQTAELLRGLGHEVVEVKPNYPLALLLVLPRYLRGVAGEAQLAQRPDLFEPRTKTAIKLGKRFFSDKRVQSSLDKEDSVRASVAPVFDNYDVMLMPMIAQAPGTADRWLKKGFLSTFNAGSPYVAYSAFWNYTGQPAASVPAGFDDEGMPLSVQLVGRANGEETLYSLAGQIERARPWADRRPPGCS